jgi:mannose-6-phosphate isomerase-like protein (cupin superfamily)
MGEPIQYTIHSDIKFGFLQLMDVPSLVAACQEEWYNQTLCQVNDCVVRLGILRGEFHWHKHDDEDEFFFTLQGTLLIDVADQTISLGPQQGYAVPRGVLHRTRAPERVVVLMIEKSSVKPVGN